jgi:hypothetical protein
MDHFTLEMFAVMLVGSIAVAVLIARPIGRAWWHVALAGASVAGILAVTLVGRLRKLSPWNRGAWAIDWLQSGDLWRHALVLDRGWLLNVALFVPAGAFLASMTRRPTVAFTVLVALSVAIEFVQRRYGLGAADPADLVANTIGAGIGVCAGALVDVASWHHRGIPSAAVRES